MGTLNRDNPEAEPTSLKPGEPRVSGRRFMVVFVVAMIVIIVVTTITGMILTGG